MARVIEMCPLYSARTLEFQASNTPFRVFEMTAVGLRDIGASQWSATPIGFELKQANYGSMWAEVDDPDVSGSGPQARFSTVHLPHPEKACLSCNGADVKTPGGESLPNVMDVQISARSGELVEVSIKMLARVEQAE